MYTAPVRARINTGANRDPNRSDARKNLNESLLYRNVLAVTVPNRSSVAKPWGVASCRFTAVLPGDLTVERLITPEDVRNKPALVLQPPPHTPNGRGPMINFMPKTLNHLSFFHSLAINVKPNFHRNKAADHIFINNMVFVGQILDPPLGLHTLLRLQSEYLWWKSHVGVP